MEIKTCNVYYDGILAGTLIRASNQEYCFEYFSNYLIMPEAKALSISLPLIEKPFKGSKLFPFFEGLLSEGWLRMIQSRGQRIDETDSFALLAKNGRDLIGAVTVELVVNSE